jgi:plasmid stabilization system protein ParE
LLEIVAFLAEDSVASARRVAALLHETASALKHRPQRGRRVPELAALPELADLAQAVEARELIVKRWRLAYAIEARHVRIVAVVDSRRDMVAWLERHLHRLVPRKP